MKQIILLVMLMLLTVTPTVKEKQAPMQDQHSLQKLQSAPLFLSWYNPALCLPENGGIMTNCDSVPTHMAGGHLVEEWYGRAAACPEQMYGQTIYIEGIGERVCLDVGGRVEPTYRRVYTSQGFVTDWYIVVDLLENSYPDDPPWWQYMRWEEWKVVD
jgi:hypothetical protein